MNQRNDSKRTVGQKMDLNKSIERIPFKGRETKKNGSSN